MSDIMFELILKSSLDYYCNQLADELRRSGDPDLRGLVADGLDNLVTIDANAKNENPAVLWQMETLSPDPFDPLYFARFSVGVKTTQDDANYVQAKLVSFLSNRFRIGFDMQLYDYSVAKENLQGQSAYGALLVSDCKSTPMMFDNQSGFKAIDVSAKVVRYI